MQGLTSGQAYVFEWWSNDSGPRFPAYSTTATAGNAVALNDNTSGFVAGALGQYAIGTFTADNNPMVITFSGVSVTPTINAFQLQTVPEPSTYALVAVGCAGLLALRRRN